MRLSRYSFVISAVAAMLATPLFAQEAVPVAPEAVPAEAASPAGTWQDEFGTTFEFTLCGEAGTDLCGVLTVLKGESATPENLAFVGQQIMQAQQTAPNEWKGSITAGGMSADATVTQTGPDTIDIQGCRAALLCQTLGYQRIS